MSVTSTTNRKSYAGDGVTTSFATNPVVFFGSSDLAVSVVSAAGVETALTENTHYTVTGGNRSTGTVNLAGGSAPYGAPAVGVTLLILRVVALTQPVDFVQNDGSDAEVQETAYDRLTMMVQQLDEVDARTIKLPPVETGSTALTELPFDRASKFLAFDASKNLIASSGTVGSAVPVSAFMETVLDDVSAAAARTTLGAAGSGAVTGSGLTTNTARLLGRTTASAGAIEEISVGASLTLSGGTLSGTAASDTQAGVIEVANQSEMEAGSSTTLAVTPGRQQFHASAAKVWLAMKWVATVPTSQANMNVSSLTDNNVGNVTVNFTTAFSTANFATVVGWQSMDTSLQQQMSISNQAPTSLNIIYINGAGAGDNTNIVSIACYGDQ